ncbi:MAG: hypothetical protein NVSMB2_12480 [Chloroflexota bacterium]
MFKAGIAGILAGTFIAGSTIMVVAQQYTTTGSVPTSSIPPETQPETISLIIDRPVQPVNNGMFGEFANVYEVQDQSPIATTTDFVAYSSPGATNDDSSGAVSFGVVSAGTIVQPLFARGDRVYAYLPSSDAYAWLGRAPTDQASDS